MGMSNGVPGAECLGVPGKPRCGARTSVFLFLMSEQWEVCAIAGLCPLHAMDHRRINAGLQRLGFESCEGIVRDADSERAMRDMLLNWAQDLNEPDDYPIVNLARWPEAAVA